MAAGVTRPPPRPGAYGIGGEDARTLTDFAAELGVSPSRVRKLEERSLRALSTRPDLCELRAAA